MSQMALVFFFVNTFVRGPLALLLAEACHFEGATSSNPTGCRGIPWQVGSAEREMIA